MESHNFASGRDRYAELYRSDLDNEAEWLRFGAIEKANTVEFLLHRSGLRLESIVELGCGTGAVISECQRRGLASSYSAVDYSADAIAYLQMHSSGIRCVSADITSTDLFPGEDFDLALLSHVIEHLEDPVALISSLLKRLRFKKLIIEVPLEDLLASRIKNRFRNKLLNRAGHVQFFTPNGFRTLLESAGLAIEDERIYVPSLSNEILQFMAQAENMPVRRRILRRATQQILPRLLRPFWARCYYAHMGVLCSSRT